ncbi:MAG: SMC-Scp complex subunit ScpB [Planctomycetota bacterium]
MGEKHGDLSRGVSERKASADATEGLASAEDESTAISLEDLRRAFEDALQLPEAAPENPTASDASETQSTPPEVGEVAITPASILEAILFVGSPTQAGLTIEVLENILHGMSPPEIEKTIQELNDSYQASGHPWRIIRQGDLYALQLLESIELVLDRLQSVPRDTTLSQTAIDCLSLIAYRPGIRKQDLESLWGQNAGATLSYLTKKGLIHCGNTTGKSDACYFTTERFLEILGLQTLDDLPQGEEL